MGIVGDRFLGSVVLPNRLTGAAFLIFLQNIMRDGTLTHFLIIVKEYLQYNFPRRLKGREGRTCITA